MAKAAIIVLAGTDGGENLGRLANALEAAKEFVETDGDEVDVVFDGAAAQWIPELEDEAHDYHDAYRAVHDEIAVCEYCSKAFGVEDAVLDAGVTVLSEYEGHPSIRSMVADDYEIITF